MFGAFAGMGLGLTATKYVAEHPATSPDPTGQIIALSMAVAPATGIAAVVVLLDSAHRLAAHTLNNPHRCAELQIAVGVLFLNALNGTQAAESAREISRCSA